MLTGGGGPLFEATRDSAMRAVLQAQPYDMLSADPPTICGRTWMITFNPPRSSAGSIAGTSDRFRQPAQFQRACLAIEPSRARSRSGRRRGALDVLIAPRRAGAVTLDITQGNVQPMPIALPDFVAGAPGEAETAHDVTQIITSNLRRCGLFAPIDPAAYIETHPQLRLPALSRLAAINAQALVTGRITPPSDGRLKAEFRLGTWSPASQLAGNMSTSPDNWRRIAHIISDAHLCAADRR